MNTGFKSGLVATLMGMGALLANLIKSPIDVVGSILLLIGGCIMLISLKDKE